MFTLEFLLSPTKIRIAGNTLAQFVGKALGAGTTFVVTILIARRLGADGYGDFSKIATYVAFFFLIGDFGLNAVYLQKNREGGWWPALFTLRLLVGIFLVFLAVAILVFIPQGTNQGYTAVVRLGIILFAPAILFQGIITSTNAVFAQHLRFDKGTMAIFFGSLATLLSIGFLVWIGSTSTLGMTVAMLVGTGVTAAVALFLVRTHVPNLSPVFDIKKLVALFMPAIPLGVTLLVNLVYFRADSVILALSRPTAEVGLYGLAYKIFEFPLVFPTFFMNAVYPLLVGSSREKFLSMTRHSALFLVGTGIFALVVLWLAAPALVYIRPEFAAGVAALRVLGLGLPFFFLSSLTMWALIARKQQIALMGIYVVGMIANIALNSWFIPAYGYMAAAWVTVASEGLVLVLSTIVLLRTVRVSPTVAL